MCDVRTPDTSYEVDYGTHLLYENLSISRQTHRPHEATEPEISCVISIFLGNLQLRL